LVAGAGKASGKRKKPQDEDDDDPTERSTKGTGKGKKTEADDVAELATEALIEVLGDAPRNKLKATDVEDEVKMHCKGHPKRIEIAERAGDEAFLQTEEGWNYTGVWVSLA
jgi:hypothetical protein